MQGLSLTEKWNTDNSLNTTVDYDKLLPGLKLTLDGSFQPNTGAKVEWYSDLPWLLCNCEYLSRAASSRRNISTRASSSTPT